MADYSNRDGVLRLAATIKQRCLIEQGSLLTDERVWTQQNFRELYELYNMCLDEGDASFATKLEKQLEPATRGARQLFGELYILDLLVLGNVTPETKLAHVASVLKKCEPPVEITEEVRETFEAGGVLNGGMGFNQRRWRHFIFLIDFGRAFSALDAQERHERLSSSQRIEDTVYGLSEEQDRTFQQTLCFLWDPEHHAATVSQGDLRKIVARFKDLLSEEEQKLRPQRAAALIVDRVRRERGEDWNPYDDREEWDPPKIKSSAIADERAEPRESPEDSHEIEPEQHRLRFHEGVSDDLLVSRAWLDRFATVLTERRQVILQGPPGTGKTYLARRMATILAGSDSRVTLVQFHPAYTYEDFFEGFRPVAANDGSAHLVLRPGPLRTLADQATENPDKSYFLVIDEINRGNLARIFGELYFLLEYRDHQVDLMYSQEPFALPPNLYLIGTMNTADRSIALVDSAMRRRFAFFNLNPVEEPTAHVLARWCAKDDNADPRVVGVWQRLNELIGDRDRMIGPSYFMRASVHSPGGLAELWETDILPQLEELYYEDRDRVRQRFSLTAVMRDAAAASSASDPGDGAAGAVTRDDARAS